MGRYCPHCHARVSDKWYSQYRFCDEICKNNFIRLFQKVKIPYEFNNQKSKRQIRRKKYAPKS
jgi:hypothetical protein